VDSALDDNYRKAVSLLTYRLCHGEGGAPVQIILTTFQKKLSERCDKYFAVKHDKGKRLVVEIGTEHATGIVIEQNDRQ
jgi:chromosome segregation ATPase